MTTETTETKPVQMTTAWKLPEEVQEGFKKAQGDLQEVLLRLGTMEADFHLAKQGLMMEIEKRAKARMDLITNAAKDAGLDTEKTRWTLDIKNMTLVKEPEQAAPAAQA